MAEYSTPEERTELPTSRRMQQIRTEGGMFHSVELEHTISLITGFLALGFIAPSMYRHSKYVFEKSFDLIASREPLSTQKLYEGFVALLGLLGPDVMLIVVIVAAVSSLVVMLQTDWCVKEKKIKFDVNLLNPVSGLRRIFSIGGLVNFGKALLKLMLFLPIGYFSLKTFAPHMIQLMHMQVQDIFGFTRTAMYSIFWKLVYVMIGVSIFDYAYGKWRWLKTNKMTKDEVKDERKSIEGDEETKRTIQRKGWARIMQRIKETVPTADVIVTNPTHYAVALKYDRASMAAPVVVAKGKNFMALKIREIAREHGIPVLERKPLARALYASVEIGAIIPRELFKAVAEVLAYVYRLKNPYRQSQNSRQ